MAKRPFPVFETHDDVSCFNCGGDFRDSAWPLRSGFAAGGGYWVQCCEKCGMHSYYDTPGTDGGP